MGVEPFLLSSSLIGVVAQRLVRVLDPATRVPYSASEYECGLLRADHNNPPTLYRAMDPQSGEGHGYHGRTGIYEMIAVDEEMRRMIHDGSGEHELEQYARQHSPSIRREGLQKVLAGYDHAGRSPEGYASRLKLEQGTVWARSNIRQLTTAESNTRAFLRAIRPGRFVSRLRDRGLLPLTVTEARRTRVHAAKLFLAR